ncbi:MAG: carbohydrate binding domain-containing protein [Prevotella sp.]|nr:carbohydrate binding domain-containing protein [Prevotella sp.]
MNKRLLLSLAVGLAAMSSFAYNVSDYIYTTDAKYKVVGENLIANGNFANGYNSWTNLTGAAVSSDFWSVEAGVGPNGENVLQSTNNADGNDGAFVFQSVPFEASKTYVVSMKVLAPTAITTSVTSGAQNYIDVFANGDFSSSKTATRFQQVATTTGIPANVWTDVTFAFTDTVTGGSTGGIQVALGRLDVGTQVTNVEIHEVTQVYDTRILERKIAYDKKLLALTEFPNGKDDLQGLVDGLEACLAANDGTSMGLQFDDMQSMTDFVAQMVGAESAYMDANSYDLVAGGKIDSKMLWTTKIQKGAGNYGDWYVGGTGRWFHQPADADYINDAIPGNYSLGAGYAGIQKTLPAGKYFFQIDAQGYAYYKTKVNGSYYTINYDQYVTNQLFAGNDTLKADTLDARNYQSYFIVKEFDAPVDPSELNVTVGFIHEAMSNGGQFNYKNPVLRYISPTAEADINKFLSDNAKDIQLNAAKVMIDSAVTVKAKVEYPWGKTTLQAGIDACTADYNALDAMESTVLLDAASGDGTTVTVPDSLTEVMRNMRGFIDAYYTENAAYTNLVKATADAETIYSDPNNAGASATTKAALKSTLDQANAAIATFAAQTDSLAGDLAKADELIAALKTASENFSATTATLANPSEIQIVNPNFEKGNASGWDTSGSQTDNGMWKFSTNDNFDGKTVITMWRGNTAYSKNKVVQTVTLTHAGAYQFSCQWYGYNEAGARDGDETTNSHVYYFAKVADAADSIASISLHTNRNYVDSMGYGATTPQYFTIVYNKTDDTPTDILFGFDGLANASSAGGLNTYFFSSNSIKYTGDFTKYTSDLETALKDEMATANAALAANPSQATDSTFYINTEAALRNAVLGAQSAIDGVTLAYPLSTTLKAPFLQTYVDYMAADETTGTAESRYVSNKDAASEKAAVQVKALLTLKRAEAKFQAVATGIQGVSVSDAVKPVVKGVYNIAGQKVADSVEGLAKGLYIVNGKKIIVK